MAARTPRRVLVALSGGIDSAVAAWLLRRQGHSVEAVFMHNWDARIESGEHCTVEADFDSAQRVARSLQIPLHRLSFVRPYWQDVFEQALRQYAQGLTPNPDMACNREIKFGRLLRWSRDHGFSHLATGHYARIVSHEGQLWIGQAAALAKDQSYFLADVDRAHLSSVLFPLGELDSKQHVRNLAQQQGWHFLLARPESMGICFVGQRRRFAAFLQEFLVPTPGEIVAIDGGHVLGRHAGVEAYTIGQHLGIGGMPARLFVVGKCLKSGTLLVSPQRYVAGASPPPFAQAHTTAYDSQGSSFAAANQDSRPPESSP